MQKEEMLHDFYEQCQTLSYEDTHVLLKQAKSQEERAFVRLITNFVLQQKQKKTVEEKRF